jgi:hypothetical protein
MTVIRLKPLIAAASLALASSVASATVVDATGDFLASFTGAHGADLDVVSAGVLYNPNSHIFSLNATMAGNVGTTPGGIYVWGVNRGLGTAGFAAIGATNVLFDMVILINGDGSGRVSDLSGGGLPAFAFGAGTARLIGDTVSLDLADSRLPGRGFAATAFTWNLWPRDSRVAGTAAISDFAPDNSNLATTVPEPASLALAGLGIAALALTARRRR